MFSRLRTVLFLTVKLWIERTGAASFVYTLPSFIPSAVLAEKRCFSEHVVFFFKRAIQDS